MRSAVAVGVTQVGEICYGTVGIEFQVVVQPHHLLHRPAGSPRIDSDSKQIQDRRRVQSELQRHNNGWYSTAVQSTMSS